MVDENLQSAGDEAERSSVSEYYRAPVIEDSGGKPARDEAPVAGRRLLVFLGILLLSCAALGNFGAFCVGLFVLDPDNPVYDDTKKDDLAGVTAEDADSIIEMTGPVRMPQGLFSMIFSALSVLGFVGGIELMRAKRRGRILALGWSAAAVVFVIVEMIVHYTHIFPAFRRITGEVQAMCGSPCLKVVDTVCGLSTSAGPYGLPVLEAFFLVLPVVYLVACSRKSVSNACVR